MIVVGLTQVLNVDRVIWSSSSPKAAFHILTTSCMALLLLLSVLPPWHDGAASRVFALLD
jgi:hypothetical protein